VVEESEEDVHYFGVEQTVRIVADTVGLFISNLEVGRWFQAGDLIGHVCDGFDGQLRAEVKTPVSGLVSGIRRQPLLFEGDLIAGIQTRQAVDVYAMGARARVEALRCRSPWRSCRHASQRYGSDAFRNACPRAAA
jgi:hypothetical protein